MAHYMVNIMSYIFCYVTVCFHTPRNVIIKHYDSYQTNYIYYSQNIKINYQLQQLKYIQYCYIFNSLEFTVQYIIYLNAGSTFFSQNITAFRNNLYHKPDNKCYMVDPNIVKGNTLGEKNVDVQHDSNQVSKIRLREIFDFDFDLDEKTTKSYSLESLVL